MADSPSDELDRLAARSLAAQQADSKRKSGRSVWPWVISAVLLAFALGLIGSPWFERQTRSHLPPELRSDVLPSPDPRVDGLSERLARLETAEPPQLPAPLAQADSAPPVQDSRIAALESRSAALNSSIEALVAEHARTSSALAMEDNRLRDLFLLALTRRLFEAGRPLTPLEPALVARFRDSDSARLDALFAWSRAPHDRQALAARLAQMEAQADTLATQGWWERVKAGFGRLVTVRGEGVAEPVRFETQMAKAQDALRAGDLSLAIAALRPLPQTAAIREWLQDARLLMAAEAALTQLETAAIDNAIVDVARTAPAVTLPPPALPPIAPSTATPPPVSAS